MSFVKRTVEWIRRRVHCDHHVYEHDTSEEEDEETFVGVDYARGPDFSIIHNLGISFQALGEGAHRLNESMRGLHNMRIEERLNAPSFTSQQESSNPYEETPSELTLDSLRLLASEYMPPNRVVAIPNDRIILPYRVRPVFRDFSDRIGIDVGTEEHLGIFHSDPALDEATNHALMEQAENALMEIATRELSMVNGKYVDLPPMEALGMALAHYVTKRGPRNNTNVNVAKNIESRSVRISLDIGIDSIERGFNNPNALTGFISNVRAHDQNAKTLLGGLMRILRKNPDILAQSSNCPEETKELQEILDAAQSLLEQDLLEKPVDLDPALQSIVTDSRKVGRRTLKLRKKSD